MDTRTLIQEAKARFKHHENKLYLQEKYKNKLTFPSQGGMWTASVELLGFLATVQDQVIIKDNFDNPIKINPQELHAVAWGLYQSTMQEWYDEYSALENNR